MYLISSHTLIIVSVIARAAKRFYVSYDASTKGMKVICNRTQVETRDIGNNSPSLIGIHEDSSQHYYNKSQNPQFEIRPERVKGE